MNPAVLPVRRLCDRHVLYVASLVSTGTEVLQKRVTDILTRTGCHLVWLECVVVVLGASEPCGRASGYDPLTDRPRT